MALTDQQLAVVLQACIEHAKVRLEEQGGFLPFGARAKPDGEIEFIEATGDEEAGSVEAIYRSFGAMLAKDARANAIMAGALVANASLSGRADARFDTVITVLLEAPEFCRSIIVPYGFAGDEPTAVELGEMIPETAESIIFAS